MGLHHTFGYCRKVYRAHHLMTGSDPGGVCSHMIQDAKALSVFKGGMQLVTSSPKVAPHIQHELTSDLRH